jgi:hypothetical protein
MRTSENPHKAKVAEFTSAQLGAYEQLYFCFQRIMVRWRAS